METEEQYWERLRRIEEEASRDPMRTEKNREGWGSLGHNR